MNQADYIAQLDERRKGIPDSKYLDYLWDNRDVADLESTICIQIASYCDPELIVTMNACIENAANPDRIHFVICHQSDDEAELEKLLVFKNCKVIHFPKAEALNPCAAKHECNKLVADEDYVMHLDSHMRFSPFWDACLIQQWKECDDPKAIVTMHCSDYTNLITEPIAMSDKFVPRNIDGRILNAKQFHSYTINLRPIATALMPDDSTKPRGGAFISAHCVFAKTELDKEIPFDPSMYFVGDDIAMAVRYWTHGYNIYHPVFRCVYYLYNRVKVMKDVYGVNISRKDITDEGKKREILRMEQLFRVQDHGLDLTGFDLGEERSIESYQEYAGVDFKTKTILNFAHKGFFDIPHTEFDLKPSNWLLENDYDRKIAHEEELSKKTILVMIPSYKDPYLMMTIESFRDNADNPNRIHFAVCYQDDDMETLDKLRHIDHCKVIHVLPKDATGVGYAYHLLESTLEDEDYVLCTESHMYAIKGWDTHLINDIDVLGSRAVISNWLGGFSKEEPLPTKPQRCRSIGVSSMSDRYHFQIKYAGPIIKNRYARGAFVIGHNVFGCSQFIRDCKHDPYMLMNTAETAYALALWTHGYDVYQSEWRYLYHHYVPASTDGVRQAINRQRREEEKAISLPRLKKYMGIIDKTSVDVDLGEYAPGTERSIWAFEQFTGVNCHDRKVSLRSVLADFTNDNVVGEYVDYPKLKAFMDAHNISFGYLAEYDEKLSKYKLPGITYLT